MRRETYFDVDNSRQMFFVFLWMVRDGYSFTDFFIYITVVLMSDCSYTYFSAELDPKSSSGLYVTNLDEAQKLIIFRQTPKTPFTIDAIPSIDFLRCC